MTARTDTVLAVVALAVAVAALVLALLVMQQSSRALGSLRRHRLAHKRASGTPDPERRQRNAEPPGGIDRRQRRDPEPDPVVPQRGQVEPRVAVQPPVREHWLDEAHAATRPPEPATAEHPAPTSQYRRPPPPLPDYPPTPRRRSDPA